jgi:hypothetical protein
MRWRGFPILATWICYRTVRGRFTLQSTALLRTARASLRCRPWLLFFSLPWYIQYLCGSSVRHVCVSVRRGRDMEVTCPSFQNERGAQTEMEGGSERRGTKGFYCYYCYSFHGLELELGRTCGPSQQVQEQIKLE